MKLMNVVWLFGLFLWNLTAAAEGIPKSISAINSETYNLPNAKLGFEENKGQVEGMNKMDASFVLFKVALPNLNLWITKSGLTYQFLKYNYNESLLNSVITKHTTIGLNTALENVESYRIDVILKNATIIKKNIVVSEKQDRGIFNYYHAHTPDGALDVNMYSSVLIKEIYPGIDWHLYINNNTVEYDFIVHPHADPKLIQLIYEGNGDIAIAPNNISFSTPIGKLNEGELLCYQKNRTAFVASNYVSNESAYLLYEGAGIDKTKSILIDNKNCFSKTVSFNIGRYNSSDTLVIDPQLVWGTYFGGPASEQSRSIACDNTGKVFVTGAVNDVGFPTQAWGSGYYQSVYGAGLGDCYIMCFSSTQHLLWATYYGGAESEWSNAVVCDIFNHVYVAGCLGMDVGLLSSTFPLQTMSGAFNQPAFLNSPNQFLLRFNSLTGVRQWATVVAQGEARSMTMDGNNNLYLTGSGNVNPAVQRNGAFNDSSFAGGMDITLLRFNSLGALTWATNYGGPDYEEGLDVGLDEVGNVFITGPAIDSFPIYNKVGAFNSAIYTGGYGDGYLLKFNTSGALSWATYLPGTTQGTNVGCDRLGNTYVVGYGDTLADGLMPIVTLPGAYNQLNFGGGSDDVCIMKFNDAGALTWSTYYGGAEMDLSGNFSCGSEMVIDPCDNVNISLSTLSTNPYSMYMYSSCNQYSFSGNAMGPRSYMLKLTSTDEVSWGTYFGGNGAADGWGCQLALDNNDNLFASKSVYGPSPNWPWPLVNPGNGAYFDSLPDLNEDIYLAKFIPINPTYTSSQVNDSSCSCGSATITLTCGEPNYSYVWSNAVSTLNTNSTSNTISGLSAGIYTVTATAACGESVTATFNILNTVGLNSQQFPHWLKLYPNPSHGDITLSCGIDIGSIDVNIVDVYGKIVLSEKYASSKELKLKTNFSSGIYLMNVITEKGLFTKKLVIE